MMQHRPRKIIDGVIHAFGNSLPMRIARHSEHVLGAIISQILLEGVWRVLTVVVTANHFELVAGVSLCRYFISLEAFKCLILCLHHVRNCVTRIVVDKQDEISIPAKRLRGRRTVYTRVNELEHL